MPTVLTADCFARLRLRWSAVPEAEELPAAIEHRFDAGRMVDHYLVTPAPALWSLPGLPAKDGVTGILFCQQADGAPWLVLLHPTDDSTPAEAEMSEAEFARLLAANGLHLPGEPGFVPPVPPVPLDPPAPPQKSD